MRPRKKLKQSENRSLPVLTDDQLREHLQLISEAAVTNNYSNLVACLKDALELGMAPTVCFPVEDMSLPLPCYLAHVNRLPLLRQLLDDGVLDILTCGIKPNDMWEYINIRHSAAIPNVCAIMERFGAELKGLCSISLTLWIQSNLMRAPALTEALSAAPCPYPHLARAVVNVTPINSQAVTIAAKQDLIDWLRANVAQVSQRKPDGFESWRTVRDHLLSQGGLTSRVIVVLDALATAAELRIKDSSVVGEAFWEATKDKYLTYLPPVSVADTCANLECIGSVIQKYPETLKIWYLEDMPQAIRLAMDSELMNGSYPHLARALVICIEDDVKFTRIAVHYEFHDLLKKRMRPRDDILIKPNYTPPSAHRLSDDDAANAWMWLIKGDGDLDSSAWYAMVQMGLMTNYSATFLSRLYSTGARIHGELVSGASGAELLSLLLSHGDLNSVKCLVESGVDVNTLDEQGFLPAQFTKTSTVLEYLIECGANVNAVDAHGVPLILRDHNDSLIECLVKHGANALVHRADGTTVLHHLCDADVTGTGAGIEEVMKAVAGTLGLSV
jgi:hypothetical protein